MISSFCNPCYPTGKIPNDEVGGAPLPPRPSGCLAFGLRARPGFWQRVLGACGFNCKCGGSMREATRNWDFTSKTHGCHSDSTSKKHRFLSSKNGENHGWNHGDFPDFGVRPWVCCRWHDFSSEIDVHVYDISQMLHVWYIYLHLGHL